MATSHALTPQGRNFRGRALRHEIGGLVVLRDGARLAIALDGIFRVAAGETRMTLVFRFMRGSRPLNLCATGSDHVRIRPYYMLPRQER